MRKGSDVIGKPIITYDTGQSIERVVDLIFDHDSNYILGILVDEKSWWCSARVIPLDKIQAIGPDAVIVMSKSAVVAAKKVPEIQKILKRNQVLKGIQLMTSDGRSLGTMVDLYFDESTSRIDAYEVSGGRFADTETGHLIIPAPLTFRIGIDVVFVPSETADMLEEQVNGVEGNNSDLACLLPPLQGEEDKEELLFTTKIQDITAYSPTIEQTDNNQLQQTSPTTSETHPEPRQVTVSPQQQILHIAGENLHEVKDDIIVPLSNAIVDPAEQKVFVIGKTVDRMVITPDATPLIEPGQVVSLSHVEAAQHWGILNQLYLAVDDSVQNKLLRS